MFGKKRPKEEPKQQTVVVDHRDSDEDLSVNDYKKIISDNVLKDEDKEELLKEDLQDYVDNEDDEFDEEEIANSEVVDDEQEREDPVIQEPVKESVEKKVHPKKVKKPVVKQKEEVTEEIVSAPPQEIKKDDELTEEQVKDALFDIANQLSYLKRLFLSNEDRIKKIEASLFRIKNNI